MDDRFPETVARLLRMLADRFDEFAEGDDLVFETLAEQLEEGAFTAQDLELAALVLRGVAGATTTIAGIGTEMTPSGDSERVWSTEERDSLSPEAWGYLLGLRRRGELTTEQFERVVGMLSGADDQPVRVDTAREAASRVVLEQDGTGETPDDGSFDITH